jgi:DNA modification methylase
MRKVIKECFRVLKPGKFCAILVGDTRRKKHYVPIAFRVMQTFLEEGFILKEDIIKHQWRCKATPFWLKKSVEQNFFLLMHEHLFIFRKPTEDEELKLYKESMKWS